ncbi:hypothetical protein BKA70DRAFT_1352798 [Coprinopsis sp. MPI-PUGE-AT-0042]|nr:hypothetical protein BKA70DRAFT_1352798 [Coprinopsis sp. MPI-PUGE-AT-0042]
MSVGPLEAQTVGYLQNGESVINGRFSASPSVPPEIVTSIVKWALLGPGKLSLMGSYERTFFQTLRSVCRLWRTTLFSTPSLWTGLIVDTSSWSESENPSDDFTRQLTSWYNPRDVHRLSVEDVLPLLRSSTLNFTSVWLPGTGNFTDLCGLASCPSPLTSIEHLGLRVFHHDGLRLGAFNCHLTSGFPNVKRLELVDPFPIRVYHQTVPELRLQCIFGASGSIAHVLERLPALTTLGPAPQAAKRTKIAGDR